MSRIYSEEEKMAYVEDFKNSGLSKVQYSKKTGIPKTTLLEWLKKEEEFGFGEININPKNKDIPKVIQKQVVFANETIRIELKEGFDKEFVLKIVQVLVGAK